MSKTAEFRLHWDRQNSPMRKPSAASVVSLTLCLCLFIYRTCATNRTFPAVFAFGDSILDTGNNNNLPTFTKANFPPYGLKFPGGKATGRFGDGKIFSDLMADAVGVKDSLPAYLDPNLNETDLLTGVSFASSGSGFDAVTASIQSLLSMKDQLNLFKKYISKLIRIVGEAKAQDIISKGLVLVSSGNNDLAITYYDLRIRLEYDISSYTSRLVSSAAQFVKELYDVGVRRIAFLGTLPLGCLPAERTLFGGVFRPCVDNINRAAQQFNSKLSSELSFLNNTLPGSRIFYLDIYNPLLDLIQNPDKSGFEVANRGCCGSGIIEISLALCDKLNPFACSDPSRYVFWDSGHPSETAYRIIVPRILRKYAKYLS